MNKRNLQNRSDNEEIILVKRRIGFCLSKEKKGYKKIYKIAKELKSKEKYEEAIE